MAKDPAERAAELSQEMKALIRTCEQQLDQSKEFYRAQGIDPAQLDKAVSRMPASEQKRLADALAKDMRDVEEEVERAKLHTGSNAPSPTKGRFKMRPMI